MPDIFGEAIGQWHRTSVSELPPSAVSGIASSSAVERIRAASYHYNVK
jgi:hypothetical protein